MTKHWLRILYRNAVVLFSIFVFFCLVLVQLGITPVRMNKLGICDYLGVNYPCVPLFDPVFYRHRYGISSSFSDDDVLGVAMNEGIKKGHVLHPGPKTFKIVVMTKDEWPLIRSWVLYHAKIFGGENLYVLDGSSDPDQIRFLQDAARRLNVVVFFTKSNLHQLQGEINNIMRSIANSTDFLTKVDSDEFIVRLEHSADYGLRDFSVSGIRDEINNLFVDGRRYKFTYYSHSVPITNCTFGDDPAATIYFEKPWETSLKTFFLGFSFQGADLGNHFGLVREPPFTNKDFLASDLAIAHYHYGCFDVRIYNTKKALLSLGYINENDPINVQIDKLGRLDAASINSGHKVQIFLEFLKDPVSFRSKNEVRSTVNTDPLNKDVMIFHGINTLVTQLHCEWEGRCEIFDDSKN